MAQGVFWQPQKEDVWLRWCDREENLIFIGAERADQAEARLRETESLLEQQQRAE